nr:NADH dehydrogenase subunit 5 [Microrhagus sp. ZM-2022]
MFYLFMFMFFSFSLYLYIISMYFLEHSKSFMIELFLMSLNSSEVYFSILFDWVSLLFMSFVLFISCMVIFYSMEYMGADVFKERFLWLVIMFVLSMLFMIISPNLISIMLGWDGLGLVSYCLVIYYNNWNSYNSGMLTVLSNRVGDVALLLSIAWMLNYGSWNFIFYLEIFMSDYFMTLISMFVVLAAMTKSAQIPFSSWLPAAMAAPTPVSALVHSSTLVTAGVYLLIRFNLTLSAEVMKFLLVISVMTSLMAGLGANFEYDLKKIIALSTLSQLGLMISILSLGDWMLAYFHLLIHALFKALLFMCAGMIIHLVNNNQDIRFMGGLMLKLPLTCCIFNLCNLSLCGLPFLSGFYSKDLALEFMMFSGFNWFIYLGFYLSIGFTMSYSFRLTYYSLMEGGFLNEYTCVMEGVGSMVYSMLGLIFIVIFSGSSFGWVVFYTPYFMVFPTMMKIFILGILLMGLFLGMEFFLLNFMKINNFFIFTLVKFLGSMWNLHFILYYWSFIPLSMGGLSHKLLDSGWFEYYGSQHLYKTINMGFTYFNNLFYNLLKIFILLMIFMVFFIF